MGLKEATAEKHKMAERMPFNGKMFRGELTKEQYGEYLKSQYAIFTTLENNFDFPHEGLKRKEAVAQDLLELGIDWINVPEGVAYSIDPATTKYVDYIKTRLELQPTLLNPCSSYQLLVSIIGRSDRTFENIPE